MTKKTFQDIKSVAEKRNHTLVSMGDYTSVKSKIKLICNNCNTCWSPSLHSYLAAKKSGCPFCQRKIISSVQTGKTLSEETKKLIGEKASKRTSSLKGVTGAAHPRYKGGIGRDFNQPSVLDYRWKNIVRKIYENKCIITKRTSTKANPVVCHHLNAWNLFPEQRYDAINGVYVSKSIHREFHDKYKYGSNTEEQWSEFLKEKYNINWDSMKKSYFQKFRQSEKFKIWQSAAYLSEKDISTLENM